MDKFLEVSMYAIVVICIVGIAFIGGGRERSCQMDGGELINGVCEKW